MELFINGQLNLDAFDTALRQNTKEFSSVLFDVSQRQSPRVESTHFLMALATVPEGVTMKFLSRHGFTADQWRTGLLQCVRTDAQCLPPARLSEDCFDGSALGMLKTAREHCTRDGTATISEGNLLVSALERVTAEVRDLFEQVGIDLREWTSEIEQSIRPVTPLQVFSGDHPGRLLLECFSSQARRVLKLLESETRALGHAAADPRHLLLSLLITEEGVTQYALHCQRITPRRVQEAVMLSLRRTTARKGQEFVLDDEHVQPLLRRILCLAGDLAAREHVERVGEVHLLRAFLTVDTVARQILSEENVNLGALLSVAENHAGLEEEEDVTDTDAPQIADVGDIRAFMHSRLVGQDEAIHRILPYVQRAKFGFSVPNRPVGVFLFCGPSGSGKTEMAKALATAVYGSEENMVFLEMGQFNARESINIFVGAPPGYVGYGEGKLTNGLRDKPRSVVLIDEVEKAHNLVLDALLRFLDEGKIDDPAGPVRDGSQCIVVLTSNVAAKELNELSPAIGADSNPQTAIRKKLRELFEAHQFRVEFLNRVDELILFRRLNAADYTEIARRLLKGYLQRLENERQIHVELEGVYEAIGVYCHQVNEGARAVHRLAMSMVVTPVIDYLLRQRCTPPVRMCVKARCDSSDSDCEPYGVVELRA